ncbi:unnamed protein product [Heterobilharzia americana]|nr:unnamed protein product [Heterobilharzia americana]
MNDIKSNGQSTELNSFNSEHCELVINTYKQLLGKLPDPPKVPIDMLINLMNIYANHICESESTSCK